MRRILRASASGLGDVTRSLSQATKAGSSSARKMRKPQCSRIWARWWRWVRSLHSPSKYASGGTPVCLARWATMLTATSSRRSGKRPSHWKAFSSTAKRSRVAPVLLPSSSRSSGESVQCWVSSSGHASVPLLAGDAGRGCFGHRPPPRLQRGNNQDTIQNCAESGYCAVILPR